MPTLAEIQTMPPDQARAALAALPPIIRRLPAYVAALLAATTADDAPHRIDHPDNPARQPAAVSVHPTQAQEPARQTWRDKPTPPAEGTTLEIVQWCAAENIPAELVGRWVWVEFPTKPAPEIIAKMKARGFRWIKTRGRWAHSCGKPCRRGHGDPRDKYGAEEIKHAAARMEGGRP